MSPEEPGPEGLRILPAPGADPGRPVSVATTAGPVIMARAAVRVTVSVHAETVTALVRHDDTSGAVAVLAGPAEVLITPSDVLQGRPAAGPGVPSTGAGLRQVYRLSDRRAR